ncbi:MAG: DUF502 domain-containing protein [Woeseiaceae bacterium]|nr:DUF502 domain-containing protein [Woeseiaceae bacterium]
MRRFLGFIKTTALGGLLVIIPISIVLFVLGQLFWGLYGVSTAIIESPAVQRFDLGLDDAAIIVGVTLAALIGLCFFTGLVVRTRLGEALKGWFGRNVAPKIPLYRALSNLTKRVAGVEGHEFAPVEIDLYGSSARALGFLVEEIDADRCAVFVPTAPVATVGNVFIVARERVTFLEASVSDAVGIITQWGVDAQDLYRKRKAAPAS